MMTLNEAARAVDGELLGADAAFVGVGIDTRRLRRSELYVALRGKRFDGHDFVAAALDGGAVGVLVERDRVRVEPRIEVSDPRLALGRLAAHWRDRFHLPLIAVTGSNGKTTIKNLIGRILGVSAHGLVTEGNLNNDIGVPLTLLRLREGDQYAVLELGMNRPGEIDYLTRLAKPTVAVIANAGRAHLAGLGSVEAVARAKGEILNGLDADGVAVLNADDPFHGLWSDLARNRRILSFSLGGHADVFARWQPDDGASAVLASTPAGPLSFLLALPGAHNVANALAAATAALAAGVPLEDIRAGLESAQPTPGRLCPLPARGGGVMIDDSYNANPDSLDAALKVLAGFGGRQTLVLGDMGELGAEEAPLHEAAGRHARELGVTRLLALGPLASAAAKAFGDGGECFDEVEALIAALGESIGPDTTVLVKGSRRMRMERVVQALADVPAEKQREAN